MMWKTLAAACIVIAFAATARAECGADHGTVSTEASPPPTTLAASAQTETGRADQHSHDHTVRH